MAMSEALTTTSMRVKADDEVRRLLFGEHGEVSFP
jgi:hypothetical protein